MFIPDPGSWVLPIPDPGSKNSIKREGWKKIWYHNFLYSHKFHKIVHYFSFEVLKKKISANFQRILELFTKKLSLSSQKYGFGIRKKPIPDPGSGGQKGTGSRIRNTGTFNEKVVFRQTDCKYRHPYSPPSKTAVTWQFGCSTSFTIGCSAWAFLLVIGERDFLIKLIWKSSSPQRPCLILSLESAQPPILMSAKC